ncbi:MAG TPA: T9SS type A sorting domain-containing protein, partial [Chitinophagales bacterium]|nr:T9SS type A sorting domain-containing protein [Chitinophagales bacterium]
GTCEDYAVYASADSGNTWSPFYTGTPPFRASKRGGIAILNNKLFAGTHYQSVWKYEGNLEIPTSIKTLTHANLLVYPNPTDNLLYIQLPENTGSASTLTIYNSNGVLVISQPATTYLTTVNTSQLPAGLYTGSVNSNSGISRFKFIVTR